MIKDVLHLIETFKRNNDIELKSLLCKVEKVLELSDSPEERISSVEKRCLKDLLEKNQRHCDVLLLQVIKGVNKNDGKLRN